MVHVLVVGGSRGIGGAVCHAAVARGHTVRAMSRSGSPPTAEARGTAGFKGDALSADDVKRALEGIDVVVQSLGVPASLDLVTKPVTLFSEATRVLLGAMQEAGVRKLVSVTGFGAGDSNASINFLQRLPFMFFLAEPALPHRPSPVWGCGLYPILEEIAGLRSVAMNSPPPSSGVGTPRATAPPGTIEVIGTSARARS